MPCSSTVAAPAGRDEQRRLGQRADRRARRCAAGAGSPRRTLRLERLAVEHDAAGSPRRLGALRASSGSARPGPRRETRIVTSSTSASGVAVAVARLVRGLERSSRSLVAGCGAQARVLDRQLEGLAAVAQLVGRHALRRRARRAPSRARSTSSRAARDRARRSSRVAGEHHACAARRGAAAARQAERARARPRRAGRGPLDPELVGDRGRVQRPGAAERAAARSRAGRCRARPSPPAAPGPSRRRRRGRSPRRTQRVEAELARRARRPPRSRGVAVERRRRRPAAASREQAPSSEVGVGDRRLAAAAAVAGRPGVGARRARADPQRAAGVAPGDRAAAGADRVDRRASAARAAGRRSLRSRCLCDLAALDHADVAGGAAHVEAERVWRRPPPGQRARRPAAPPAGPERTVQAAWPAARSRRR